LFPPNGVTSLVENKWSFSLLSLFYGAVLQFFGSQVPTPGTGAVPGEILLRGEDAASCGFLWHDYLVENLTGLRGFLSENLQASGVKLHRNSPVDAIGEARVGYSLHSAGQNCGCFDYVVNCAGRDYDSFPKPYHDLLSPLEWITAWNVAGSRACFGLQEDFLRSSQPLNAVVARVLVSSQKKKHFIVPRDDDVSIGTWYQNFAKDVSQEEKRERCAMVSAQDLGFWFPHGDGGASTLEFGYLPARAKRAGGWQLCDRDLFAARNGYAEFLCTKFTTFQLSAERLLTILLNS
jgi:hypothetical protein